MAEAPKNVDEVMQQMKKTFNSAGAQGLKAVYQYCITGAGGKDFYTAIDNGTLNVSEGKHSTPSITITVDHQDFLKMLADPMSGQALFMQGKIRVEPMDLSLMMRMQSIFPRQ